MTTATKNNTNIEIDSRVKKEVIKIADWMWLNLSTVVNLLLRKFVIEKKKKIWEHSDFQTQPFSEEEKKQFESLHQFNDFMLSIKWK